MKSTVNLEKPSKDQGLKIKRYLYSIFSSALSISFGFPDVMFLLRLLKQ